ncbi:MAG: LptF/LptG family permease [Phycisphaerales bacterium]
MALRLPITFWRHLLAELWRLLLLTAAVVVAITSFAFTVRFLADGQIGPVLAVRVMVYMLVPMLQYALPFAAGFAATLAYHRAAGDRELTACYAGGISHRRVLAPALATGLVLAVAVVLLTDQVMPRLLRAVQELVSKDVTQLLVGSIRRGESVRLGAEGQESKQIYADDVQVLGPDEKTGAYMSLLLTGVLAVDFDKTGAVRAETSSRAAYVWLYRVSGGARGSAGGAGGADGETFTSVVLTPRDVVGRTPGGLIEGDPPTWVYHLPSGIKDDPKFFTWSELEETKARPERINWLDRERRGLAIALGNERARGLIGARLAKGGTISLSRPDDAATGTTGRTVTLSGAGLGELVKDRGWTILPAPNKAVEVTTMLAGGQKRVQRANRAYLAFGGSTEEGPRAGTISIVLERVSAAMVGTSESDERDPALPRAGEIARYQIDGLTLGGDASEPWETLLRASTDDLLQAASGSGGEPAVAAASLRRAVVLLRQEIVSKQHERVAFGAACAVMVLCGAVTAMRLSAALPLTVYLWSFWPSIACILTISTGQRQAHLHGAPGLALLWGGVVAMLIYTLVQYRWLARR